MFDIDHISFAYNERVVIDDLSLKLTAGCFYGIVGPNGCGKTTLLDLLLNYLKPAAGQVKYKGNPISDYSVSGLAQQIAVVPQNFYINFSYTAKEIVMMGRYPYIPRFSAPTENDFRIVEDVMAVTSTDMFSDRIITELSGGERQRVIFARALAQDTPVLILDEATSNLDVRYALNLLNLVRRDVEEKEKTVLAVLHDINLAAAFCDELIFMKNGAVVSHGKTAEVLTDNTIQIVFDVTAKVLDDPFDGTKHVIFRRE